MQLTCLLVEFLLLSGVLVHSSHSSDEEAEDVEKKIVSMKFLERTSKVEIGQTEFLEQDPPVLDLPEPDFLDHIVAFHHDAIWKTLESHFIERRRSIHATQRENLQLTPKG